MNRNLTLTAGLVGILLAAWSTALLLGVVSSLYAKTIEGWKGKKLEGPGTE